MCVCLKGGQASYMGFPATAGADYLPWLIADKVCGCEGVCVCV